MNNWRREVWERRRDRDRVDKWRKVNKGRRLKGNQLDGGRQADEAR